MGIFKKKHRRALCKVCSGRVFYLSVKLDGVGMRSWWHEDYSKDKEHVARPGVKV